MAWKSEAQTVIAEAQIKAGDIAGARKTLASAEKILVLIQDSGYVEFKSEALANIADAQIKIGDIAEAKNNLATAEKTAALIANADDRHTARLRLIAEAQGKLGVISTRQPMSDWLEHLDDGVETDHCPLNTGPFLDLAGHLKSLPPSDNPQEVFESLRATAEKIVSAQNVITGMLNKQAGR